MIGELQSFAFITYIILVIIGIIFIFIRSDRKLIIKDLKKYFEEKPFFAVISVIIITIISPITIPFSIAHFPRKKK